MIAGLSTEGLTQPKTLICGIGTEPPDLLPSSQNQGTMDRTYSIYEPLVWLDEDAQPVPRLATKWEVMDGNKAWRFHLRRNVLFHNGENSPQKM
jgi:ABC-type transport system substrate-binding protein